MKLLRVAFGFFVVSMTLAGCGGRSAPSAEQAPSLQSKQLKPADKAQVSDYQAVVQELYVAFYGRPADPAGLTYWEGVLLANNAPTSIEAVNAAYSTNAGVKAIVDSFGTSAESTALYGSGDASAFVAAVYQNVLGRTADSAGQAYWANLISSKAITQVNAALAIMSSAASESVTSTDEQIVNNRLAVATYFTAQVVSQNSASAYTGNAINATVRSMLDAVTATTSPTAYQSTVDALIPILGNPAANSGSLALFAGSIGSVGHADGTGSAARFYFPTSVAVDATGNVYVADQFNNIIRKISSTGLVSTLAGVAGVAGSVDGPGATARFNYPAGVALDSAGNVYVADSSNNTIRKISPTGVVSTVAGTARVSGSADGAGTAAQFNNPQGVAMDSAGNLYVADSDNDTVRKITPAGMVSTVAGIPGYTGNAYGPFSLNYPTAVATDSAGNVYIADSGNSAIRKITPDGKLRTLSGGLSPNGLNMNDAIQYPYGVATDKAGNVYEADAGGWISKITPDGTATYMAVTTGSGTASPISIPEGIASDSAGNLYVADSGTNTVLKVAPSAIASTLAGTTNQIGSVDGVGTSARFNHPTGVTSDSTGNVYVVDAYNATIRKITPGGSVSTLAGTVGVSGRTNGSGTAASFLYPSDVATDSAGNVYVAETNGRDIRKITPAGVVTALVDWRTLLLAIPGTMRSWLTGIAVDGAGNVYVADHGDYVILKITAAGAVSTFVSTATLNSVVGNLLPTSYDGPRHLAIDSSGNLFASVDNMIVKITPAGVASALAGVVGVGSNVDGTGAAARFFMPQGITVDSANNLYVADSANNTIRKVTPAGSVSTVVGVPGLAGFVPGTLPGGLTSPTGVTINGRTLYITTEQGLAVVNNLL